MGYHNYLLTNIHGILVYSDSIKMTIIDRLNYYISGDVLTSA